MKIFACILLCLAFLSANAQKKWEGDYIVLNNNDTLYGKVWFTMNYVVGDGWVRLKTDEGKRKYISNEVKALRYQGADYIRHTFTHIKWENTQYLRVLIEGKISLLYIVCERSRAGYDLFAKLENGDIIMINQQTFEDSLLPILKASPTFMEKAGDGELKLPRYFSRNKYGNYIQKLVHWYNGTRPSTARRFTPGRVNWYY